MKESGILWDAVQSADELFSVGKEATESTRPSLFITGSVPLEKERHVVDRVME